MAQNFDVNSPESDDEDFLYENSDSDSCERFVPDIQKGNADTPQPTPKAIDVPDPSSNEQERRQQYKKKQYWKKASLVMLCITISLAVTIILSSLYLVYYQPCSLFLQEVRLKLPSTQHYLSDTIKLNMTLVADNPNRVHAEIEHAYLRVTFSDDAKNLSYPVHEPVRFPTGNVSTQISPQSTSVMSFLYDIKVDQLSEGLRVVILLNQGCFTLSVKGEISYRVATFPHTTHVTRSQRLFSHQACPYCGNGPPLY